MSSRSPATIAAILTVVFLVLLACASVLVQMIALNGASEGQGVTAMIISLGCQAVTTIVVAVLATRLTDFAIDMLQWSPALAVGAAVTAALLVGAAGALVSILVALPLAGIG